MLKVKNLSYKIGSKNILNKISFDASPGTLTAIIGPNGAGKSTLLKQISNQQINSDTQVLWKEKPLREYKSECIARERAVFSQKTDLDAGFDVQEVVMMGRYPYFKYQPSSEDYCAIEKALVQCEMKSFSARPFSGLSGGEQQRVHFARVLAQLDNEIDNKLLILDEPLNNLDVRHQFQLMDLTRNFAKAGNTVLMVLHDIQMALRFADQVLILKAGEQIAFGPVSQILDENLLASVYEMDVRIMPDQEGRFPIIQFESFIHEHKLQL
jgi:iron complex transport system ATP-binding protein